MKLRTAALLSVTLLASACQQDDEVTYQQFNAPDDNLSIEVGVSELLDPVSIDLWSNTKEVVIGRATASPGRGPAGTLHELVVEVSDEYEDIVDRASVQTQSGDRGADEYEMTQDYADEGIYKLELQSVADEGEVRTDTLNFRLWDGSEDTG